MPAMYPEALRSLREQNPGLQFDFRGNLIDDGGYGASLQNWSPYRQAEQNGGILASLANAARGGILRSQVDDLFYGSRPDDGGSVLEQDWNRLYGPQYASGAVARAAQGLGGYSYQNDQFVGPVLPGQQQGYGYSDYDQARPLQPGVSNLSLPNVGFYSQWDPGTNSWVRHGSASDGLGMGVPRRRASGQNGDPYGLRGFTPYVEAGETPYRDMWRGSPETTETFPNLARTQE